MANEQSNVGVQYASAGAAKQVIPGVKLAPARAQSYIHPGLPESELTYQDHMLQLLTNHFSMAGVTYGGAKHAAEGLYEHLVDFHRQLEALPVEDEKATAKAAYDAMYVGGGAGFSSFFHGWKARAQVALAEAAKWLSDVANLRTSNAALMLALKAVKDEGWQKAGGGFWIIRNSTLAKVDAAFAAGQAPTDESVVQAAAGARAEEDTAQLDWLDQNLFHRSLDDFDSKIYGKDTSMWVFFAPTRTGGGTARQRIGEAMAAEKTAANQSKSDCKKSN